MWTVQLFGWGDEKIFVLFFVLRESGVAKRGNMLKKIVDDPLNVDCPIIWVGG
jgi:hypothetical protein